MRAAVGVTAAPGLRSCVLTLRCAASPAPRPQRDREILKGIAPAGPRQYPLRKGETVSDVLKGRGVSMAEAQALNPGVDLAKASAGQLIKLPYGRYTQREKEMLSSVVPASSLGLAGVAVPTGAQLQGGLLVMLAIAAYAFYVKKAKEWSDKNNM
jgi:hypothetical protein